MRILKRSICNVVFEALSPSYYRADSLELFYAGLELGWRIQSGDWRDPQPYLTKEAAVQRYIMSMQNFG